MSDELIHSSHDALEHSTLLTLWQPRRRDSCSWAARAPTLSQHALATTPDGLREEYYGHGSGKVPQHSQRTQTVAQPQSAVPEIEVAVA